MYKFFKGFNLVQKKMHFCIFTTFLYDKYFILNILDQCCFCFKITLEEKTTMCELENCDFLYPTPEFFSDRVNFWTPRVTAK